MHAICIKLNIHIISKKKSTQHDDPIQKLWIPGAFPFPERSQERVELAPGAVRPVVWTTAVAGLWSLGGPRGPQGLGNGLMIGCGSRLIDGCQCLLNSDS